LTKIHAKARKRKERPLRFLCVSAPLRDKFLKFCYNRFAQNGIAVNLNQFILRQDDSF
jgi:hypothetical protein